MHTQQKLFWSPCLIRHQDVWRISMLNGCRDTNTLALSQFPLLAHPSVLHVPVEGRVSHFFWGLRGSGDVALQTKRFQMQTPNVGGDRNRHTLWKSTSFIMRRRCLLLASIFFLVFIKQGMMMTTHATGNTIAGTGIVEIYGPSLHMPLRLLMTLRVVSHYLGKDFSPTPSHYVVKEHFSLESTPKLGVVAFGGNWDSA